MEKKSEILPPDSVESNNQFSFKVTGVLDDELLLKLENIEIVKDFTLDPISRILRINVKNHISKEEIVDEIEKFGVDLEDLSLKIVHLTIEGMMCQKNCGTTVFNAIIKVKGVSSAKVSFESKTATIKCESFLKIDSLIDAIDLVGFDSHVKNDDDLDVIEADIKQEQDSSIINDFKPEQLKNKPKSDGIDKIEVSIKGMSCAACVANIEKKAKEIDGLKEIQVALVAEKASIYYDSNIISAQDLCTQLSSSGYKTILKRNTSGCLLEVHVSNLKSQEDALKFISSVLEPLSSVTAEITAYNGSSFKDIDIYFSPQEIGCRKILKAIQDSNYFASLRERNLGHENEKDEMSDSFSQNFKGAAFCTLPLVIISWFSSHFAILHDFVSIHVIPGLMIGEVIMFFLASIVQFRYGAMFYKNALKALKNGVANMDVLVVLGTSSAFTYSFISMVMGIILAHKQQEKDSVVEAAMEDSHFFETGAMLITFVLLGKYLESIARKKTAGAITALMDLQAPTALIWEGADGIILKDGKQVADHFLEDNENPIFVEIDLRLVEIGDVLQVQPGSKIPVDGIVIRGKSKVDESMLTGESKPVSKHFGSKLVGGSVNENGTLFFKATHIGSDTALARIVRLVEDAQSSKAPIQAIADRISRIFVPTVVVVALCTFFVWMLFVCFLHHHFAEVPLDSPEEKFIFCFKFGVAVLVISCPCALGLATPTAVMVATGVGAQLGILIKGAHALEVGQNVTSVIFDKTGTLTIGSPSVIDFKVFKGSKAKFLSLVASAEQSSEHPLAQAISAFVKDIIKDPSKDLQDVEIKTEISSQTVIPGHGITAFVEGIQIVIGNQNLFAKENIKLSNDALTWQHEKEVTGATVVFVGFNGKLSGCMAIRDQIKPSSASVIAKLLERQIDVWMVTGDNYIAARAIADELSLPHDKVIANVLPEHKCDKVKELQDNGEVVAMVGDGINDAPALSQADLGVSIGTGTDVAVECADVILIKNDLMDVVRVIELSRATLKRIRLNLWFSFGYNVIGIPLAAGLFFPWFGIRLPPPVAGAMMACSSVSVVLSSLSLRYFDADRAVNFVPKMKTRGKYNQLAKTDAIDEEQVMV